VRGLGVLRLVPPWALTLASLALVLRGVDAVPGLVAGTPRGVSRHVTLEAAERRVGFSILLPSYFPEELVWPPEEIATAGRSVALRFRGRDAGLALVLVEGPADGGVSATLLPRGEPFHTVDFDLGGRPARLVDLRLPPDGTWHELSFVEAGRRVVLRFRGPSELFLRMAESIRTRGRSGIAP